MGEDGLGSVSCLRARPAWGRERLRVLLSAYACEPGQGSEPGVGWSVAQEVARHHDVWVLTRANNRPSVEQAVPSPPPGLAFVYYDLPRWARWWKRGQRGIHFYYYLWQIGAYRVGRRLHRAIGFDVIHHVTFARYWMPSFLSLLPVPFVWGPVGGAESAPRGFWRGCGLRARVQEALREAGRCLGELDLFVRLTARRSAVALAATEQTAERLRRLGAPTVRVWSQLGLPRSEIAGLGATAASEGRPVRFVGVGRLLHWKGFHLGLRAFARAGVAGAEYWIIGDGPERPRLMRAAQGLGLADRVHFLGWLPREEVLRRLQDADVLVHPSLHDSGAWVCIEAMAARRPVICLDLGGPGAHVVNAAGVRIAARQPQQAVDDLAATMRLLARHPRLRRRMGERGAQWVRDAYCWERKGRQLATFYRGVARDVYTSPIRADAHRTGA